MSVALRIYSLDTSALIDWWEVYSPDVFPGLLIFMQKIVAARRLCAVRYVRDEIKDSSEDSTLAKWCRSQADFYLDDDEEIQTAVSRIMEQFQVPKKKKGIKNADPFVIARAQLEGENWYVVSSERPANGNIDKNPNIPFVCNEIGVNHISLLEMFRMERWKLE